MIENQAIQAPTSISTGCVLPQIVGPYLIKALSAVANVTSSQMFWTLLLTYGGVAQYQLVTPGVSGIPGTHRVTVAEGLTPTTVQIAAGQWESTIALPKNFVLDERWNVQLLATNADPADSYAEPAQFFYERLT